MAAKSAQPARPAPCTVDTWELGVLQDGSTVAHTLSEIFPDFLVKPRDRNSTTLDIVDRSASEHSEACGKKRKLPLLDEAKAKEETTLKEVLRKLDSEAFQTVEPQTVFVVRVPNLCAKRVQDSLPYPVPDLRLEQAGDDYLVMIPPAGKPGKRSNPSGEDLVDEAAGVKHDLTLLDEQFAMAASNVDKPQADQLRKDFSAQSSMAGQYSQALAVHSSKAEQLRSALAALTSKADANAADWLGRHSVTFWQLPVRDAMIAFAGELQAKGRCFEPLAAQDSAAILPCDLVSNPHLLAQEAFEGALLYQEDSRRRETSEERERENAKGSGAVAGAPQSGTAAGRGQAGKQTPNPSDPKAGNGRGSAAAPEAPQSGNSAGQRQSGKQAPNTSAPKDGNKEVRWTRDRVVRLYNLRDAKQVADAINTNVGQGNQLVKAVGQDLLLILSPAPGAPDNTEAIERAVVLLDMPRPQISFQVWSFQISSKAKKQSAKQVQDYFVILKQTVENANLRLWDSLARGFGAVLQNAAAPHDAYFDDSFRGYLTEPYRKCIQEDQYCLGYRDSLLVPSATGPAGPPGPEAADFSLSRFLLYLAAAKSSQLRTTLPRMEAAMNGPAEWPPCAGHRRPLAQLSFPRFFQALNTFSESGNLHKVRAAVLDFLFYYKGANAYPGNFSPYNLRRSARVLDSLLSPVVRAFNEDVDSYVEAKLAQARVCMQESSATFGEVQVGVVSGNQASVTGKVQNYFDITQPPTLADMLNTSSPTSQALTTELKNVLEPKEIAILSAIVSANSQQKITAQVGKDTTLTVTPTSLDTGSSADLDLSFEVADETAPAAINSAKEQQDLLNRVSDFKVSTRVRVDSLKLFQVSAFTMELTHPSPRRCLYAPICAAWQGVFGSIPGFGHLFEYRPEPKTIDNRSVAIVRATIVPTAMDLALGVRFGSDDMVDPVTHRLLMVNSPAQLGDRITSFHRQLVRCIAKGQTSNCFADTTLHPRP